MTCEYSKINQHDALYDAVRNAPGGVEAMAQRLNTSGGVLYNKLRRRVTTHHVSFEEFSRVLECLEESGVPDWAAPLHALCWRHAHVAVALPPATDSSHQELISLVCAAFKEQGDVADRISKALADTAITPKELEEIEGEIEQAVAALMVLKHRVRANATLVSE